MFAKLCLSDSQQSGAAGNQGIFQKTVSTSTTEENLDNTDYYKVIGESSFFESKIWTEYSKLLAIHDADEFCDDNNDIVFPDNVEKNLYYRCQNGKKELYQCVEDFEFDSSKLRCIPKNWDSREVTDCSRQMNGFYPDFTKNCQKYYSCKNGLKLETLICPPNESFNFHLQKCQLKREVTCAKSICQKDNDDFFIYPGSQCQAYYYCHGGTRSDFICPKGTIFDISLKACVENGICYEPVCAGRIDGTYADTTHSCKRSFTCKGGTLEEVNSCPAGKRHDGYSCVLKELQKCEKPEKTAAAFYFQANDECKSLSDGSHIVPGTDCREVRICLRGKTSTTFECPRDQRFHGNRCFPRDVVPCDDVCSMKSDGFYPDEFTNCQGYYLCLNGKVSKRKQCSLGTAFNGTDCTSAQTVLCPKNTRAPTGRCIGLRDGFHPDYLNRCQNYFYCYNYDMVLTGSCASGMIWNGKQCIKDDGSICRGPSEIQECLNLTPGLYQNKTSNCTKYFYCNNGSGTSLSCPDGLLFNGYKCVTSDEYTCLNSDDCIDEPDGYRQDQNTACRSYYFCSNGNKITYVCRDGLLFNGTNCVSQDNYECPFTPSKDCVGKPDGYHPEKVSDCKKYFYCFKGEKLNTLECGGKKIFNGQGCVLMEDPKSACLDVLSNPCKEKKNGIYSDIKSECKKYFTCANETLVSESWCPKGSGFNGIACVRNFSCSPKNQENACDGKHIGFYQDLLSNCRNYYFCFWRTKTVGTCPSGTIFNGHLCIDSNYYTCPSGET